MSAHGHTAELAQRHEFPMTLLKSLREAVYCNGTTLRLVQCHNPLSTSEDVRLKGFRDRLERVAKF